MIGNQTFYADQAEAEMAALAEGLESLPLTEAMQDCSLVMKQSMRDSFNSRATPDNADWPPRKRIGDGHPLLQNKGNLLQAATGGGAGHIEQVGKRDVAIGVDGSVIPYAATHNFGRNWGRGAPIPQREYAGLTPEGLENCEEIIGGHVMQEVFG